MQNYFKICENQTINGARYYEKRREKLLRLTNDWELLKADIMKTLDKNSVECVKALHIKVMMQRPLM